MTTKTDTKTRPRRRRALFTLTDDEFFPTDVDLPKPIAEANAAALDARDRWHELSAKAGELGEQAKAAPNFDAAAAEAALATGEDPPPTTAPAKRAAADDARQAAAAAEQVTKDRVSDLYDAVDAHYDEHLEQREAEAAELRESIRSLVPEALERLVRYGQAQAMLEVARRFVNNPNNVALAASGGSLAKQYQRELDRQRGSAALRPHYSITADDPAALLAALTLYLERDDDAA
jgi:hypothetical protein